MTIFIGNLLNWIAAGLLLPVLLLPAAALGAGNRPARSFVVWVGLVAAVFGAGLVFALLAVDLEAPGPQAFRFTGISFILTLILAPIVLRCGAFGLAQRLHPPAEIIVRVVGRFSLWLALAMVLLQFAIVMLRYVFGLNFIAMQESVTYLHGGVFLLGAGYALLTNDHVRVDIVYRGASERYRALVDLAGAYLFLFPFCLVALWASGPYVANSWAVFEGSPEQSGLRGVFLLKALIPVYATLLALAGFVTATRAVASLRAGGG